MDAKNSKMFRGASRAICLRLGRSLHAAGFCGTTHELHAGQTPFAAVLSSNITPVYAKQNLYARRSRFLFASQLLALAFFLAAPRLCAGALEDAPHQLAMKLCTSAHQQAVNVRWQETADSSGYWSDPRKKAFLDQISACGIAPTDNPDAPVLRVTAGLTPSRVLLVAESSDAANARQIRMVEVLRDSPLSRPATSAGPHLAGELLWQQERPISSALEWQDAASRDHFLFLLGDGLLVRMHLENGSWRMMDSAELPSPHQRARGGDGSFVDQVTESPLEFLRDRKMCAFQPSGDFSLSCVPQDLPVPPLLLSSPCEPAPRYLTSGKGDYAQPDQIFLGGTAPDQTKPAPANHPEASSVDVPGPVLGITLAENGAAALAVVRNLSTGNYEVYRVTAVCGN